MTEPFEEELKLEPDIELDPPRRRMRRVSSPWFRCMLYCAGGLGFIGVLGIVLIFTVYAMHDKQYSNSVKSCGDCFCIPDNNNSSSSSMSECPANMMTTSTTTTTSKTTDYPSDIILHLRGQESLNNIQEIPCNPFTQQQLCPPLSSVAGDDTNSNTSSPTAVCGLHYRDACSKYKLRTYDTLSAAFDAGAFVTHFGHCGLCSTTQDLSVLMEYPDEITIFKSCADESLTSINSGQLCYAKLGLTSPCAKLRAQQAQAGGYACFVACQTAHVRNIPFNGYSPNCTLNDCLQCQENRTEAIFAKYAGRTMRSSGILSSVVRNCSELADITHVACPSTLFLK